MTTSALFTEREQQLLDYTIEKRYSIIDKLTAGDAAPEKSSDKILVGQLLDGLDKAIHTKAKLNIDNDSNKKQDEINSIIGNLLTQIDPKRYVTANGYNSNHSLPKDLRLEDPVAGETDITPVTRTYEQFIQE
jgi:hypothetical protein